MRAMSELLNEAIDSIIDIKEENELKACLKLAARLPYCQKYQE